MRRKFADILYSNSAALFAAVTLAFIIIWWKLIVLGQLPADGNLLTFFWPDWSLLKTTLSHRELPLWNHYKNMGEPFLANPQTMALYPLSWASPALGFLNYMRLWVLFHTALAFVFSFLTLNRIFSAAHSCADPPKLFGGNNKKLALSGAFLYSFSALFTSKATLLNYLASAAWIPAITYFYSAGSLPGLCIAVSLQLLSGFPPYFLITFLALAAFAVFRQRGKLSLLLKAYGLSAGICAVMLLPFIEMFALSTRGLMLDPRFASQFSAGPLYLLKQLFVPFTYFHGYATEGDPALLTFYAGPVMSALAVFAAVRGNSKDRSAAAFALIFFFLSLGGNIPLYSRIPFINVFRFPAHWLLPGFVFTVYLAVRGLSLVSGLRLRRLLGILLILDAFSNAMYMDLAWVKPGYYEDAPALAVKIKTSGENARILHSPRLKKLFSSLKLVKASDYIFLREILTPSLGAAFGVPEADSYQVLTSKKTSAYLKRVEDSNFEPELLSAASIKLVLDLDATGGIKTYWNSGARGLVYCLPDCESLKYERNNGKFAVEMENKTPVRLVLAEIFYPGWKAEVDGKPFPVDNFDETFMSLEVTEKGKHSIVFRYCPVWFYAGLTLSLLSLAFLLYPAFRRKKPLNS